MTEKTETCTSRGPRIGDDGVPICGLPRDHFGLHEPDPESGWDATVRWGPNRRDPQAGTKFVVIYRRGYGVTRAEGPFTEAEAFARRADLFDNESASSVELVEHVQHPRASGVRLSDGEDTNHERTER